MADINLKISDGLKHFSKPIEVEGRFDAKEKARMADASKKFEGLLTSMMLKSMTQTSKGMFGEENSFGGTFLDTFYEMNMSDFMSQNRSLGVAQEIYKKLTGEDLDESFKYKNINATHTREALPVKNTESSTAIKPSNSTMKRVNQFDPIIEEASQRYGIDKNIIKSVIFTESAGKNDAMSNKKAKGLMQLIDSTAKDMGVTNVWDPKENILGGTKYLANMLKKYDGDVKLSLAAYNAGPGNVDKYKGIPPFEETQNYVERVLSYFNYLES